MTEYMAYAFLAAAAAVVAACIAGRCLEALSRERVGRLLRHRAVVDFDNWYDVHGQGRIIDRGIARSVLDALAAHYGCHPTQIWPSDRFEEDLSADACLLDTEPLRSFWNEDLPAILDYRMNWCGGISPIEVRSVGDLLERASGACYVTAARGEAGADSSVHWSGRCRSDSISA